MIFFQYFILRVQRSVLVMMITALMYMTDIDLVI